MLLAMGLRAATFSEWHPLMLACVENNRIHLANCLTEQVQHGTHHESWLQIVSMMAFSSPNDDTNPLPSSNTAWASAFLSQQSRHHLSLSGLRPHSLASTALPSPPSLVEIKLNFAQDILSMHVVGSFIYNQNTTKSLRWHFECSLSPYI
jgi:hypothetical protein